MSRAIRVFGYPGIGIQECAAEEYLEMGRCEPGSGVGISKYSSAGVLFLDMTSPCFFNNEYPRIHMSGLKHYDNTFVI